MSAAGKPHRRRPLGEAARVRAAPIRPRAPIHRAAAGLEYFMIPQVRPCGAGGCAVVAGRGRKESGGAAGPRAATRRALASAAAPVEQSPSHTPQIRDVARRWGLPNMEFAGRAGQGAEAGCWEASSRQRPGACALPVHSPADLPPSLPLPTVGARSGLWGCEPHRGPRRAGQPVPAAGLLQGGRALRAGRRVGLGSAGQEVACPSAHVRGSGARQPPPLPCTCTPVTPQHRKDYDILIPDGQFTQFVSAAAGCIELRPCRP